MAATTDLYDLLREYLTACEEAVALTPGGPIARSFVSAGLPAFDCPEQLSVHAGGPAEADTVETSPGLSPGHRTGGTMLVNLVAMTATVVRCSPTVAEGTGGRMRFPDPAQLDDVAKNTTADLWAIWNHVRTKYRAGNLFVNHGGGMRELFFDPAVALATSGGTAGWMIQIRVQLDGFAL